MLMSTISHSCALENIIIDRINSSPQHRITFAEYMDLVLYHPQYGYYCSGTVKIGSQGDFFTSPSLGSDFGELLAEQLVEMWSTLGYPVPFMLVEMGAGLGLLAADILQYLHDNYLDFFQVLEYTIIEQSEALIKNQQNLLKKWLAQDGKISWQSWNEISEKSIIGCVFSNEVVDAFPVHQIMLKKQKFKEIYITNEKNKLTEVVDEISTEKLKKYFELIKINLTSDIYPDDYCTEVNLFALDWIETIANRLHRGYLLTIDYGYTAQRYYHPQRYKGTLQCYYQHHRHDNPYINIGYQDITTHVDFTALERQGELCGLQKLGFSQQGMFLMALGLGDRLSALSNGQYNFQQILQRRDALHQLIDPSGLGGFGVLVQTMGLTEAEKERSLQGLKDI